MRPEKILIWSKGALIDDFGITTVRIPSTLIGTDHYKAFEIRKAVEEGREEEFTNKIDVYSLGIIEY